MKLMVEFIHFPEGRHTKVGPFEFLQFTYSGLQAFPSMDSGEEVGIAFIQRDGFWKDSKGQEWTDLIIHPIN